MLFAATVASPIGMTPEQFCAQYAVKVARFASFAAGRDADPDDIAQDALLKALHARDRYDPARGPMDAWLWRIVVNTARDAMRGARLRALLPQRLAPEEPTADVEDTAIERVTSSELYAAIARLSGRPRRRFCAARNRTGDRAVAGDGLGRL